MSSYNRVILMGNLGKDPEVKVLGGGKAVATFSIAVNEKWKGQDGEQQERTTWVDCEAWARTAELIGQYLTAGSACMIDGKLRLDTWQDKEGQKRSKLKVVVDNVQFLGGGRERSHGDAAPAPAPRPSPAKPQPIKTTPERAFNPDDTETPPF